jgi:release factor glutamine methyltransferase
MINIRQALSKGKTAIKSISETNTLDSEILLCDVLKISKAQLYAHPEQILSLEQSNKYIELINLRVQGMPIAYIIGYKEFWSLKFHLSNKTLIPRADTELLVEKSLEKLKNIANPKILELGTGSGAIAIAIAKMRPDAQITACDICEDALTIARNNAKLLAINNIKFVLSDWFSNITTNEFDGIISNPPYIAARDRHLLQGDVKFEPTKALISGEDGLESLKYIITHSINFLADKGFVIVEHGYNQRAEVNELLKLHNYHNIICWKDLSGNDRVSCGDWIL